MMEDKAYKYARNLLFEIFRRECPEKEVEALDDTIGVLTQIDHMTAHLFSRIEALTAERDAARDAALEEAAAECDRLRASYARSASTYADDDPEKRKIRWSGAVAAVAAENIRALKGKSHE